MTTAIIRKDTFNSRTRCWTADLIVDGELWKSWSYGFKSIKSLTQHIIAVRDDIEIIRDTTQDA